MTHRVTDITAKGINTFKVFSCVNIEETNGQYLFYSVQSGLFITTSRIRLVQFWIFNHSEKVKHERNEAHGFGLILDKFTAKIVLFQRTRSNVNFLKKLLVFFTANT